MQSLAGEVRFGKLLHELCLDEREALVKRFLEDMALDYHRELEQWSLIDVQPTNVGFDYLAQMLVSLVTSHPGTGTAARGIDIVIPGRNLPPRDRETKRLLAQARKAFQQSCGAQTSQERQSIMGECRGYCKSLYGISDYYKCESRFTEAKLHYLEGDLAAWNTIYKEALQHAGKGQGEVKSVNEIHCTDVQRWHTGSKDLLSWHTLYLVRWDLTEDERFRVRVGIPDMHEFRDTAFSYFSLANRSVGQRTPWDLQLRPIGRHKCHCSGCGHGNWKKEADANAALALPRRSERRLELDLLLHAEDKGNREIDIQIIREP